MVRSRHPVPGAVPRDSLRQVVVMRRYLVVANQTLQAAGAAGRARQADQRGALLVLRDRPGH